MQTQNTNPNSGGHGVKEGMIETEGRMRNMPAGFRFGRMFPSTSQSPMILKLDTCERLGERMTAQPEASRKASKIPAGYTYFGQFVDHDVSMDMTHPRAEGDNPDSDIFEATLDRDLVQARSPSLDLDSLYGPTPRMGPMYNGPRFEIGLTSPSNRPGSNEIGPVAEPLRYDLPRGDGKKALIGDPRNDENLAVAQTHLMWLKFHNAVVDQLKDNDPGASDGAVFENARDLVTKHYQHIVLHDFVRRFIQEDVYQDIIVEGNRKALKHCSGEVPFMPLEFSVAAYRFGHSQVRETYDWNSNFGTGGGILTESSFRLLFTFSGGSGNLGGNNSLPTNWIANFRRLYDFGKAELPSLAGATEPDEINFAMAIDPYIASALGDLPEIREMIRTGKDGKGEILPKELRPPFANLAALNLRRGSMRNLPSGQDVSRELPSVKMLTKSQMKSALDPEFDALMEELEFYDRTPLWLYILIEAAALNDGERLGPLGSTIVADTFMTLVNCSRCSIANSRAPWTPEDAQATLKAEAPLETIPQVLLWMDKRDPIIDPLQDSRLAPMVG